MCGPAEFHMTEERKHAIGQRVAAVSGRVGHRWQGVVGSWTPVVARRVPTFYRIDKKRRFVHSTVSGEFTYDEAIAHQRDLSADRDFDPTFAQICDFTYATLAKISSEEVVKFAQRSIFSPDARRALIIPNLPDYGLGRMYETVRGLEGQTGVRAFRTLEEAVDWVVGSLPDA